MNKISVYKRNPSISISTWTITLTPWQGTKPKLWEVLWKRLKETNVLLYQLLLKLAYLVAKDSKGSAYNAEGPGSSLGLGRGPGEGNGNLLQYSCLGNLLDRGAWWPTVYGGSQRVIYNLVTFTHSAEKALLKQSIGFIPLTFPFLLIFPFQLYYIRRKFYSHELNL